MPIGASVKPPVSATFSGKQNEAGNFMWGVSPVVFYHSNSILWDECGVPDHEELTNKQRPQSDQQ